MSGSLRYRLFGLTASSSLRLPLPEAGGVAPIDIEIVLGSVTAGGVLLWNDTSADTFACWRQDDIIVLAWPDVRFAVGADRVVVDASDPSAAAMLLVPAVWSIVLAARGQESLHGSAVERCGRAVAVLGHSGAGKSSAALSLLDHGWRLVTDDLLTFDAWGRAVPGPPILRLAPDRAMGRSGQPDPAGKFRLPVVTCADPVPLVAVIILDDRHERCERLAGAAAASAVLEQVYAPVLTHGGQPRRRFDLALQMVSTMPVYGAPPRSLTVVDLQWIAEGTGT